MPLDYLEPGIPITTTKRRANQPK